MYSEIEKKNTKISLYTVKPFNSVVLTLTLTK